MVREADLDLSVCRFVIQSDGVGVPRRIVNLILGPHPNVPMLARFNLGEAAGYPGTLGHFPFRMVPLLADAHQRRVAREEEEGEEEEEEEEENAGASGSGTGAGTGNDGDDNKGNDDVSSAGGAGSSAGATAATAATAAECVGEKRKRANTGAAGAAAVSSTDFAYENWQESRHHMSIAQASAALGSGGADAFVSVTGGKFHALHVIQTVMPLLAPSACFALFCPYIEPLKEAALWLKKTDAAVDVDLMQMWVRNFQVLPGRTRPDMNMDDGTGFVLKGIKCVGEEVLAAVAAGNSGVEREGESDGEGARPTKKRR